jgi:hypothetical protein
MFSLGTFTEEELYSFSLKKELTLETNILDVGNVQKHPQIPADIEK